MKKLMSHMHAIYTYYTITVLVVCVFNLLRGYTLMDITWFLELLLFFIVFTVIERFMEKIRFKNSFTCTVAISAAAYCLVLIFSYLFYWIRFTPLELLFATLMFLIITIAGTSYMRYRYKLQIKEINDLLQKKNS